MARTDSRSDVSEMQVDVGGTGDTILRAVLLDVDGTLVDSNDAHAAAWHDALVRHGHDVPIARLRPLIGMGGDKLLAAVTDVDPASSEGREILEHRGRLFLAQYAPRVVPFPAVRELLVALRGRGLELVVASSAKEQEVDALLAVAGVEDILRRRTSADDAARSKPDRDIIDAALRDAGARPEEAVLVGDTPYDVEAGRRAGVPVVALRCGGTPEPRLRGAVAIYDDPADLLARLSQSPLVRPVVSGAAVPGR